MPRPRKLRTIIHRLTVPSEGMVVGASTAGAAGQVRFQLRVNGEPATVGVAVSVQAKVAVAAAVPRVQDRLIEPAVVEELKTPLAGVVVTAPKDAAPAPLIEQPVTADEPAPTAPAALTVIVLFTEPAAPAGKLTPAAVVGL